MAQSSFSLTDHHKNNSSTYYYSRHFHNNNYFAVINSSMAKYKKTAGIMNRKIIIKKLVTLTRKLLKRDCKVKQQDHGHVLGSVYSIHGELLTDSEGGMGSKILGDMNKMNTVTQKLIMSVYQAINEYLNQKIAFSDLYAHYFILPSTIHTLSIHIDNMRSSFDKFRSHLVNFQLILSQELFQLEQWNDLFQAISKVQYAYSGQTYSETELISRIKHFYTAPY